MARFLPFASLILLLLAGCAPPEHEAEPTPAPTPEPSPTPLYIPYKRLDTGRLFNGIDLHTSFGTEPGRDAASEAASPSSYSLQLDLRVRIPTAVSSLADLSTLNPALPALFPALPDWLKAGRVSPLYERLYRFKVRALEQNFLRLDQLLSRHDFFDCQTILELRAPASQRKFLLVQAAMDVDSDGSDPDRVPIVDASSLTFQPLTSYKWPKRGPNPNPFAALRDSRLAQLQAQLPLATGTAQRAQLQAAIDATRLEARLLRTHSFLVASTDPFIVVPGSLFLQKDDPWSPGLGDYAAIVSGSTLYPAIVGDVGPAAKVGEASLRIAQEINPRATSENRPVSALKVTYLIFPGSADHPFGPPDLPHWHDRVASLLKETGTFNGALFAWTDLTVPPPTPTPSPAPSPSPALSGSLVPALSPSPAVSPALSGSASPAIK